MSAWLGLQITRIVSAVVGAIRVVLLGDLS